jgi:hypothetical protein
LEGGEQVAILKEAITRNDANQCLGGCGTLVSGACIVDILSQGIYIPEVLFLEVVYPCGKGNIQGVDGCKQAWYAVHLASPLVEHLQLRDQIVLESAQHVGRLDYQLI